MSDVFHWPLSSGEEVCRYVDHIETLRQAEQTLANVKAGAAQAIYEARQQGQRDALAALDNAEVWGRIMRVLNDNGVNNGTGLHSWRCFDNDRYPEPCACAAELVVEIIQAIKGD